MRTRRAPGNRRIIWVLLVTTVLLAGCGFHLRGSGNVPDALAPMALNCTSGTSDALCREVRGQLELHGLLAGQSEEPAHTLTLSGYNRDRRVSALGDRAAAAEYEIQVSVNLDLATRDNIPLLSDTTLTRSEVYRTDEEQVLAEELEKEGVAGMLQRDIAEQVSRRLTSFTESRIQLLRQRHQSDSNGNES